MFKDRRIRTSLIAIAADILLTLLKAGLALITGSAALLADAYHSGADLIVSLVLLGSLLLRFREERKSAEAGSSARTIECVLAILVSFVILYVPFEILSELDERSVESLNHIWIGIAGVLVIIAIVHFMARFKTYVGKETDSPALEADGYHSKIDLFSTIAVLVSLVGTLVGIYLDEIVAIIIAVMIGIAGLELLVSGVRSLMRGDDLDQVSILDNIAEFIARIPFSSFFISLVSSSASRIYRIRWYMLPLVLIVWGLTGFTTVPYGYTGIKERFGATATMGLDPGLHYTLPWPVENVQLIESGRVLATTVGSRMFSNADVQSSQDNMPSEENANEKNAKGKFPAEDKLWRSIKASRVHKDNTLYLATGDENLIDIQFTLQYRIADPIKTYLQTRELESMVERFTENALWRETALQSFESILMLSHHEFSDSIAARVVRDLASVGIDIELVDAQIQSLQPPAMVVPVYRDLLNASQEKQQRQNRAQAQRTQDLLMANAERITQKSQVAVDAVEKKLRAQGETERFSLLANVYAEHGDAMQFNQYIRTLVNNLSNKPLLITDPAIDKDDYRIWGGPGALQEREERK